MQKKERGKISGILSAFSLLLLILFGISSYADAQEEAEAKLSQQQLEQILAPVALYPDDLLSQVLVASTYPLEIVQADRWLAENKNLKGEGLKAAAQKQNWDDSIKSLVATPDIIHSMSENLESTQKLGDAVLAQQEDVMNAVQSLRNRAYAEKTLQSSDQQKVEVTQLEGNDIIVIESADPETVYVPYYNPTVVYGSWPYPYYPPVYYPEPIYYPVATAFAAGLGFAAGAAVWDDIWDSDCDWGSNDIDINVDDSINIDRGDRINGGDINRDRIDQGNRGGKTKWKHNPEHRRGVQYNNKSVRNKFSPNQRPGSAQRENFRGRMGENPGNLGGQTRNLNQPAKRQFDQARPAQNNRPKNQARPQNNRPNFSSVNKSNRSRDSAFSDINRGRDAKRYTDRGSRSFDRNRSGSSRNRSSGGSRGRSSGGGSRSRGGGGGRRR